MPTTPRGIPCVAREVAIAGVVESADGTPAAHAETGALAGGRKRAPADVRRPATAAAQPQPTPSGAQAPPAPEKPCRLFSAYYV